jgi:hypothetical protein
MTAERLLPTVDRVHSKGGTKMKKTLIITIATIVLVAVAATAALFALSATAGSHPTCGKVNQTELRAASDPDYAKNLEQLARCGR